MEIKVIGNGNAVVVVSDNGTHTIYQAPAGKKIVLVEGSEEKTKEFSERIFCSLNIICSYDIEVKE